VASPSDEHVLSEVKGVRAQGAPAYVTVRPASPAKTHSERQDEGGSIAREHAQGRRTPLH